MLAFFKQQAKFNKVINEIKRMEQDASSRSTPYPVLLENVATNVNILLIASLFQELNKTIVLVCSNIFYANRAYDLMLNILPSDDVSFFPGEEQVASELIASSNTFRLARMQTIASILEDRPQVIVTNTEGVLRNLMSTSRLREAIINFRVGQVKRRDEIIEMLVARGYKKTSVTESNGSFSVRGSIIDVFGVNMSDPVRISFFDDEIESIRIIDVESQKSISHIDQVTLYPVYEMYYHTTEIETIKERVLKNNKLTDKVKQDLHYLEHNQNLDQLYLYLPYIDPNYQNFLNFIPDKIVVFDNFSSILEKEKQDLFEMGEYLDKVEFVGQPDFFSTIRTILPTQGVTLYVSQFTSKPELIPLYQTIDLKTSNNYSYNNNFKVITQDLKTNTNKTYIITHQTQTRLNFFKELLNADDIDYYEISNFNDYYKQAINLLVSPVSLGYIDYEQKIEILSPYEMTGNLSRPHRFKQIYRESTKIYSKEEIQTGDYVVHRDYGIGRYLGIKTVQLNRIKNDYLLIEYADESKIYVPVENIYVLEKYIGSKENIPKLTKLGSKEWEKKKAKVKAKVVEVAKMLLRIQAQRELMKGYAYPPDSVDQLLFEADFEYKETEGQRKAVEELKRDLESGKPVDRLLCGDVGFGKTEVAMRGAFKVVEAGKQVAYLAPTTVLARQHYQTFKDRFEKFGVRVELLNRFVDRETTKYTLEGLRKGYVDIVIGTHRLLSKDIVFKDLGLLIIDEEHRFGVEHKERIKELKANVDVLSLSATPIPRTLQMALTGIRDLSIIETPPQNRTSVQTYVLETNDSVIREAIHRELGRHGQVFYLLNRISDLDRIVRKLHKLVPEARVGVIHGRMDKEEIEETMNNFIDRNFDVLVCTTIIETGIDVPNANTLLIERADILGLAQIYQIRGRVGRSDRLAYAYLMYDKHRVLTETAKKRLETIKEFTALGSGYKIAMRDLSIRGAGDILGSEQSGFIDALGIDLYMNLLNEAIEEQKGVVKEKENAANYNIQFSKHIDESYVDDDVVRIDMHKSISKIKSRDEVEHLKLEFSDRYGTPNEEVKLYLEGKYLLFLLKSKGVEAYKEGNKVIEFHFDEQKSSQIKYQQLQDWQQKTKLSFQFSYRNKKIFVKILLAEKDQEIGENNYIYRLTKLLENI